MKPPGSSKMCAAVTRSTFRSCPGKAARGITPTSNGSQPKVARVPGDFAEIGVFRGAAFRKVTTLAAQQGKRAHAFDSFTGMNEPTPADGGSYPKGMFDVGGPEAFEQLMTASGVDRALYDLWPGYVPASFSQVPDDLRFSWAIVDLDQYPADRRCSALGTRRASMRAAYSRSTIMCR